MADMESIYAWTAKELETDYESVIVSLIPAIGIAGPLQHQSKEIADKLQPFAERHLKSHPYHKVRLVRFDRKGTLEELK